MQARLEKHMDRPSVLRLTDNGSPGDGFSYSRGRASVDIELTPEQVSKIEVNMAPLRNVNG